MARQVITETDIENAKLAEAAAGSTAAGNGGHQEPDSYNDRLIKYIPAEVVSVYLFVSGALFTAKTQISQRASWWAGWIVFGFMAIMTPIYMKRLQGVTKRQQLAIVFFSFIVWVFSIGGPFTTFGWYHPIWGAILLPLYTFSIPIFQAKK
jgi:hypothetical protein